MNPFPTLAIVVPHTHWDREWYRTRHEFQLMLLDVVDRAMDALETDPAFSHFMLDGQAIMLEDYLELRPEQEPRLRQHVQAGRLSIGPWYVLADEFLVSGESHVRNLLVGRAVARRFGEPMAVGYLPDAFGHIAQMPQLLKRAGFACAVFTRGMGDELDDVGWEHLWRAPDGSTILAYNQCKGYCAAGALGYERDREVWTGKPPDADRAIDTLRSLFAAMEPHANGAVVLVSNGCDHLPPQPAFGPLLATIREAFSHCEFRVGTLAEFMEAVGAAGTAHRVHAGERLGGKRELMLSGVWSTRVYLKQLNAECETLLSRVLEPLSCVAHFLRGAEYPAAALDALWKRLLENHPHDSICGCSIDEVHREMVPRFEGVLAAGRALTDALMISIRGADPAAPDEESGPSLRQTVAGIEVFNPLPAERVALVRRLVTLGSDVELSRLTLLDDRDDGVPFVITDAARVQSYWSRDIAGTANGSDTADWFHRQRDDLPQRFRGEDGATERWIVIEFRASLEPLTTRFYRLTLGKRNGPTPTLPAPLASSDHTIENDLVGVTLHSDGRIDIVDKRSGIVYGGLNRLESTEDVGDEYDYCPAKSSRSISTDGIQGTRRIVSDSGLRATLECSMMWKLPVAIAADRSSRSQETIACPVRIRVSIERDTPMVELDVELENRVRDHRVRTKFMTPHRTHTLVSDGHFYLDRRPIAVANHGDWVQPPTGTYPQREFSSVQDGTGGLAVVGCGLHEVAPIAGTNETAGFAVTLLRGVGWLSRDDLETRNRRIAGPMLATPDAQCLGTHRFRLGIVPFQGDVATSDVRERNAEFRVPPLSIQTTQPSSAAVTSLVRVSGEGLAVSAIKRHETRDTLVVRLYNVTDRTRGALITTGRTIAGAWQATLLEDRVVELAHDDAGVGIELGAHEIVTLEIAFTDAGDPIRS